jgi:uncharacterized protein (DUF58 family)
LNPQDPRLPPVLGGATVTTSSSPPPLPSASLPLRLRPSATWSPPPPLPAVNADPLLVPEELERFKNLLVFARSTVEGYFVGKHRSPYRGSSVEFADYKEYVPGDEVSRIDWRAFGRSRRLFVRQYEAETDMVIYLLVDVSASMNYPASRRLSKYRLAAKIAAALAYLMVRQGDKAALVLFAKTLNHFRPPGGTRRHLHNLIAELEAVTPAAETGIAQALRECNPLFKKRGRLVILSDFWDDTPDVFDALAQFLHRKFEVLLLQVLHPDELNLPPAQTARFEDMETGERLEVEPEEIRAAYRQAARQRVEDIAREANHRRITHALIDTRQPYLEAIEAYLGFRGRALLTGR